MRSTVARLRVDREQAPSIVTAEDPLGDLDARVAALVAEGAADLAQITARVLRELPSDVHYVAAGRIAETVARIARVCAEKEREWAQVIDRLEIENWVVRSKAGAP